MQKWGVREHLDDGKSLLDAIIESEEYTEYILDRRLGCRQLGMNLPRRSPPAGSARRYTGHRRDLYGVQIWSPYFERDYIRGMATDKIPRLLATSSPRSPCGSPGCWAAPPRRT